MKQIYLFIDFDGVLHPTSRGAIHFCCMPLFAELLRRHPSIYVVISSSWRKSEDYQEVLPHTALLHHFPEDLQHRVIGRTPALALKSLEDGRYLREEEVNAWRRENGAEKHAHIILDDSAKLFSPGLAQLVLCNPDIGFDVVVLRKVEELITRDEQH